MVELALLMPLGVLLLLGAIQFGWAFYLYNELERGVRDAARYAGFRTSYNQTEYGNQVRNVALCGLPDCTGRQPLVPNLTTAQISWAFTWAGTGAIRPDTVVVWINDYTFPRVLMPLRIQQSVSNPAQAIRLRSAFPYQGRFIDPATKMP
jgi:hypothetical protein